MGRGSRVGRDDLGGRCDGHSRLVKKSDELNTGLEDTGTCPCRLNMITPHRWAR